MNPSKIMGDTGSVLSVSPNHVQEKTRGSSRNKLKDGGKKQTEMTWTSQDFRDRLKRLRKCRNLPNHSVKATVVEPITSSESVRKGKDQYWPLYVMSQAGGDADASRQIQKAKLDETDSKIQPDFPRGEGTVAHMSSLRDPPEKGNDITISQSSADGLFSMNLDRMDEDKNAGLLFNVSNVIPDKKNYYRSEDSGEKVCRILSPSPSAPDDQENQQRMEISQNENHLTDIKGCFPNENHLTDIEGCSNCHLDYLKKHNDQIITSSEMAYSNAVRAGLLNCASDQNFVDMECYGQSMPSDLQVSLEKSDLEGNQTNNVQFENEFELSDDIMFMNDNTWMENMAELSAEESDFAALTKCIGMDVNKFNQANINDEVHTKSTPKNQKQPDRKADYYETAASATSTATAIASKSPWDLIKIAASDKTSPENVNHEDDVRIEVFDKDNHQEKLNIDDRDETGIDDRDETGIDDRDETGIDDRDETGIDDRDETGIDDRDETGIDVLTIKNIDVKTKAMSLRPPAFCHGKTTDGVTVHSERVINLWDRKGDDRSNVERRPGSHLFGETETNDLENCTGSHSFGDTKTNDLERRTGIDSFGDTKTCQDHKEITHCDENADLERCTGSHSFGDTKTYDLERCTGSHSFGDTKTYDFERCTGSHSFGDTKTYDLERCIGSHSLEEEITSTDHFHPFPDYAKSPRTDSQVQSQSLLSLEGERTLIQNPSDNQYLDSFHSEHLDHLNEQGKSSWNDTDSSMIQHLPSITDEKVLRNHSKSRHKIREENVGASPALRHSQGGLAKADETNTRLREMSNSANCFGKAHALKQEDFITHTSSSNSDSKISSYDDQTGMCLNQELPRSIYSPKMSPSHKKVDLQSSKSDEILPGFSTPFSGCHSNDEIKCPPNLEAVGSIKSPGCCASFVDSWMGDKASSWMGDKASSWMGDEASSWMGDEASSWMGDKASPQQNKDLELSWSTSPATRINPAKACGSGYLNEVVFASNSENSISSNVAPYKYYTPCLQPSPEDFNNTDVNVNVVGGNRTSAICGDLREISAIRGDLKETSAILGDHKEITHCDENAHKIERRVHFDFREAQASQVKTPHCIQDDVAETNLQKHKLGSVIPEDQDDVKINYGEIQSRLRDFTRKALTKRVEEIGETSCDTLKRDAKAGDQLVANKKGGRHAKEEKRWEKIEREKREAQFQKETCFVTGAQISVFSRPAQKVIPGIQVKLPQKTKKFRGEKPRRFPSNCADGDKTTTFKDTKGICSHARDTFKMESKTKKCKCKQQSGSKIMDGSSRFKHKSQNISPSKDDEVRDGLNQEKRLAGLSQEKRQAGLSLEKRQAGLNQEKRQAGFSQEKRQAGFSQETKQAGFSQENKQAGLNQEKKQAGLNQEKKQAGFSQEKRQTGFSQENKQAGLNQEKKQAGFSQEKKQAGFSQEKRQTGFSQENKQAGLNQEKKQAGFSQEKRQAGFSQENKQAGLNQENKQAGSNQEKRQAGLNQEKKQSGLNLEKKRAGLNLEKRQASVKNRNLNDKDSIDSRTKRLEGEISSKNRHGTQHLTHGTQHSKENIVNTCARSRQDAIDHEKMNQADLKSIHHSEDRLDSKQSKEYLQVSLQSIKPKVTMSREEQTQCQQLFPNQKCGHKTPLRVQEPQQNTIDRDSNIVNSRMRSKSKADLSRKNYHCASPQGKNLDGASQSHPPGLIQAEETWRHKSQSYNGLLSQNDDSDVMTYKSLISCAINKARIQAEIYRKPWIAGYDNDKDRNVLMKESSRGERELKQSTKKAEPLRLPSIETRHSGHHVTSKTGLGQGYNKNNSCLDSDSEDFDADELLIQYNNSSLVHFQFKEEEFPKLFFDFSPHNVQDWNDSVENANNNSRVRSPRNVKCRRSRIPVLIRRIVIQNSTQMEQDGYSENQRQDFSKDNSNPILLVAAEHDIQCVENDGSDFNQEYSSRDEFQKGNATNKEITDSCKNKHKSLLSRCELFCPPVSECYNEDLTLPLRVFGEGDMFGKGEEGEVFEEGVVFEEREANCLEFQEQEASEEAQGHNAATLFQTILTEANDVKVHQEVEEGTQRRCVSSGGCRHHGSPVYPQVESFSHPCLPTSDSLTVDAKAITSQSSIFVSDDDGPDTPDQKFLAIIHQKVARLHARGNAHRDGLYPDADPACQRDLLSGITGCPFDFTMLEETLQEAFPPPETENMAEEAAIHDEKMHDRLTSCSSTSNPCRSTKHQSPASDDPSSFFTSNQLVDNEMKDSSPCMPEKSSHPCGKIFWPKPALSKFSPVVSRRPGPRGSLGQGFAVSSLQSSIDRQGPVNPKDNSNQLVLYRPKETIIGDDQLEKKEVIRCGSRSRHFLEDKNRRESESVSEAREEFSSFQRPFVRSWDGDKCSVYVHKIENKHVRFKKGCLTFCSGSELRVPMVNKSRDSSTTECSSSTVGMASPCVMSAIGDGSDETSNVSHEWSDDRENCNNKYGEESCYGKYGEESCYGKHDEESCDDKYGEESCDDKNGEESCDDKYGEESCDDKNGEESCDDKYGEESCDDKYDEKSGHDGNAENEFKIISGMQEDVEDVLASSEIDNDNETKAALRDETTKRSSQNEAEATVGDEKTKGRSQNESKAAVPDETTKRSSQNEAKAVVPDETTKRSSQNEAKAAVSDEKTKGSSQNEAKAAVSDEKTKGSSQNEAKVAVSDEPTKRSSQNSDSYDDRNKKKQEHVRVSFSLPPLSERQAGLPHKEKRKRYY